MNSTLWFLATLAVAGAGGLIMIKLKVPAGAIIGSILAVGIMNIIVGNMYMPDVFKIVTKAVAGLFIGLGVTIETVRGLKKLVKPTLMLVVIIIGFCFCMGLFLFKVTSLDAVTALFCVAPGGMTDMTLMSLDLGGDSAVVAVLQSMRLLTVYCISMPLVKVVARKFGDKGEVEKKDTEAKVQQKEELDAATKKKRILFSVIVTIIGALVGQFFSVLMDFSVMVLIISMFIAAGVNIKTGKLYMPKFVRQIAQILSGALIGTNMSRASLQSLKTAIIPALVVCLGFIFINFALAILINRTFKIDMTTSMLSTSAGGAPEAVLVAGDFGADATVVSVLQITRMVCTTIFYPIIVKVVFPILEAKM